MQPNLQTLALLSTASIAGAPYVTAFLTQSRLPKWANALIAFLVCFLAGLVSFWQSGGTLGNIHSSSALLAAVGVIFIGAKAFYVKLGYRDPMILALKNLSVSASAPANNVPTAPAVPALTSLAFDLTRPDKTLVMTVATETPAEATAETVPVIETTSVSEPAPAVPVIEGPALAPPTV